MAKFETIDEINTALDAVLEPNVGFNALTQGIVSRVNINNLPMVANAIKGKILVLEQHTGQLQKAVASVDNKVIPYIVLFLAGMCFGGWMMNDNAAKNSISESLFSLCKTTVGVVVGAVPGVYGIWSNLQKKFHVEDATSHNASRLLNLQTVFHALRIAFPKHPYFQDHKEDVASPASPKTLSVAPLRFRRPHMG